MSREVIVYDRQGNAIRLIAPERYPPPARQQYGPPAQYEDYEEYPPPSQYRPRRRSKRESREDRARRVSGLFFLFMASWIPTGFGWPGITVLIWAAGFSFLLYRWIR